MACFLAVAACIDLSYIARKMNTENQTPFLHYFNWTMSYQRDADIALVYGRVVSTDFWNFTNQNLFWGNADFRWHHGRLTTSLQIAAHLVLDVSMTWPARNSCHHLHAGPARAAAYCHSKVPSISPTFQIQWNSTSWFQITSLRWAFSDNIVFPSFSFLLEPGWIWSQFFVRFFCQRWNQKCIA